MSFYSFTLIIFASIILSAHIFARKWSNLGRPFRAFLHLVTVVRHVLSARVFQ